MGRIRGMTYFSQGFCISPRSPQALRCYTGLTLCPGRVAPVYGHEQKFFALGRVGIRDRQLPILGSVIPNSDIDC